jgi:hypothetical protein
MKRLFFATLVIVIALAAVSTASAADYACKKAGNQGWHIVPNNIDPGNFYPTQAECEAALAALLVTPTATAAPTNTAVPTETASPTETAVPTSTGAPTEAPTGEATLEPTVTTPVLKVQVQRRLCQTAYEFITGNVYKDDGYKILRNHSWCKVWIYVKHGAWLNERK